MIKPVCTLGLLLSLALPAVSHALGLGRIKVHSALNEPLSAEIEFTSVTDKELKGLTAALATRAEFESAGVERLPYLSVIKFAVAKKLDGRYILQLTTDQQVDEPFLHLLLQVEWPGGRLVREYSALIDPPYQVSGKPSGIEPPKTQPTTAAPAPAVAEAPAIPEAPAPAVTEAPKEKKPEPVRAEAPSAAPATAGQDKPQDDLFVSAPPPAPEAAPERPFGPAGEEKIAISSESGWPVEESTPKVEPLSPTAPSTTEQAPEREATPVAPRAVAAEAPAWSRVGEYAVKQGDTLWEIAERVREDRQIATEQVVLAIYKANRDAFFGNNVNNLRAGKILKMPEREIVDELTSTQARTEFRAQYDVWQEYRLKLASAGRALKVPEAAEPPKAEEPSPAPEPARKEAARKAAPESAAKPAEDLLKIVRSNLQGEKGTPEKKVAETESTKDAKERQALAERVTTLEESLLSKQIEAKDLGEKIGQVRAQLKKESRLIEIESQPLAQAAKKSPAPAAKEETKAPKAETAKPAAAEPPKSEPAKTEAPKAESKPAATVKKETPAKRPVAPPPPAEEKGFVSEIIDSVLGNELLPILLGVVVLASGGIAFLYMRRRRKSIAEFEESILTSDAISTEGAASTTTDTSGQVVSAGDTSFLSDFSQGGMGNIHTDEVDPVAEAEVYLAYGRDETAEEILKDAVVKNPERHELKLKLLEIYHQRNDVHAFETLAEELYAALGGRRDKVWEKVEEMGRKLSPANPMFRGGAPGAKAAAAVAPAAPAAAMAFADTQHGLEAPQLSSEPSPAAVETTGSDFDFDTSAPAKGTDTGDALDFDLGGETKTAAVTDLDFDTELKPASAESPAADTGLDALSLGGQTDSTLDFDVGLDTSGKSSGDGQEGGAVDLDFNLAGTDTNEATLTAAPPAGGTGSSAQWDETATKLDLAKAYIDMGDAEGARSILDEVVADGNEAQKKQARELAAQLG
jgi:pilus assembly protein FimV